MKVLVTGAAGQLGGALLACAPDDCDVRGLTRDDLDLSDEAAIRAVIDQHRPDWVINCAAYTGVDKAESEPELAIAINGHAPAIMAQALAETGGRLFQISTDFVFDGEASAPYLPGAPRNPISVYGVSKAAGEDGAKGAIILRTSWVYSAGGANFVRTMLRLMGERDTLSVVADQIGAPSYAPEIARTIWALIAADAHGIFHHRDNGEVSWHGFAQAIAAEARELGLIDSIPTIKAIPTSEYPTPAKRPAYSVLDDSATRALLGDQTRHWRENLRRMLIEEKALG